MAIKKKRPRIKRMMPVITQEDDDNETLIELDSLDGFRDPCGYVEDDIEEVPVERPIKPNNIK